MVPLYSRLLNFTLVWIIAALPSVLAWFLLAELGGWPSNDDPFYAKPLFFFANEGEWRWVKQNGELTASSVAHMAFGWLLTSYGECSYRCMFLACIVQQSFGVAAVYCTSRALRNPILISALAAASMASFPLYFGHAFTFMTDGPSAAWAATACCCSVLGTVKNNWRWLVASSIATGWGFWIRQTNGLLLIAPVVTWGLLRLKPSTSQLSWSRLIALTLPALLAFAWFESGWLVESNASRFKTVCPTVDREIFKEMAIAAYGAMLLSGWLALPWMMFAVRAIVQEAANLSTRSKLLCNSIAIATFAIGLIPFAFTNGRVCITNATGVFIQNAHFGPIFLSDMDEPGRWSQLGGVTWPMIFWKVLSIFSITSSALLTWWIAWSMCALVRAYRSDSNTTQISPLASAAGISVAIACSSVVLVVLVEPHMDRYWLFVHAAITVWWIAVTSVHKSVSRRFIGGRWGIDATSGWAASCLLLNLGISVVFTHDMLAWNNARWNFINQMLASGMYAKDIDGGRDVNAWLRLDEDSNSTPRPGDKTAWWSGAATLSLAVGERPGWHEVERVPWCSWATGREHYLLVLEKDESLP